MAVRLLLPFPPRGARATERPAQTSSLWALDRRGRRAGVCCLWDPLHTWWGLRAAGWGPGLARRPFPPFQLPPPPATLPPPPAKPQPRWRKGSGGGPHCQAEPGSPGAHTPRATARRHRPPVGGACGRSAQGLNLGPGSGCGSLGRRGAGVRTAWAGGWLRACVCAPGGAHKDIRLLPRPSASLTATTRIRGSRAGSSPARSALRGLPQGFPGSGSESSGRMILLGLQCAPCWQEEPSGRPGICTPVLLPWALPRSLWLGQHLRPCSPAPGPLSEGQGPGIQDWAAAEAAKPWLLLAQAPPQLPAPLAPPPAGKGWSRPHPRALRAHLWGSFGSLKEAP